MRERTQLVILELPTGLKKVCVKAMAFRLPSLEQSKRRCPAALPEWKDVGKAVRLMGLAEWPSDL